MKLFIWILTVLILVISFNGESYNVSSKYKITIFIKGDTIPAPLALVKIFRKGSSVIDTSANWNGIIIISSDIEKILIDYAGCYPKFINIQSIKNDTVVVLDRSPIMDSLGGMANDPRLNQMYTRIEAEINKWNARYGSK